MWQRYGRVIMRGGYVAAFGRTVRSACKVALVLGAGRWLMVGGGYVAAFGWMIGSACKAFLVLAAGQWLGCLTLQAFLLVMGYLLTLQLPLASSLRRTLELEQYLHRPAPGRRRFRPGIVKRPGGTIEKLFVKI